jgi:putative phosphoribosyl transferase
MRSVMPQEEVTIPASTVELGGELSVPRDATGLVLFAHGSGSSRHSPRNQFVARTLRNAGIGTLLFDLLTQEEENAEAETRHLRFNIGILADRLIAATRWAQKQPAPRGLKLGYFGSSTGAGAALVAAANLGEEIGAVVSRGGRPDLAGQALQNVTAPTLLMVGSEDRAVIRLNEQAYQQLRCEREIKLVAGASHLFEEPGTLEQAAALAAEWLIKHLK